MIGKMSCGQECVVAYIPAAASVTAEAVDWAALMSVIAVPLFYATPEGKKAAWSTTAGTEPQYVV